MRNETEVHVGTHARHRPKDAADDAEETAHVVVVVDTDRFVSRIVMRVVMLFRGMAGGIMGSGIMGMRGNWRNWVGAACFFFDDGSQKNTCMSRHLLGQGEIGISHIFPPSFPPSFAHLLSIFLKHNVKS